MLKQLFDYVQQLMVLGRYTQQNRRDLEELRRELQKTNALVIELSQRLERLAERECLEREMQSLQLENVLLRFERLLPARGDTTKRG